MRRSHPPAPPGVDPEKWSARRHWHVLVLTIAWCLVVATAYQLGRWHERIHRWDGCTIALSHQRVVHVCIGHPRPPVAPPVNEA